MVWRVRTRVLTTEHVSVTVREEQGWQQIEKKQHQDKADVTGSRCSGDRSRSHFRAAA